MERSLYRDTLGGVTPQSFSSAPVRVFIEFGSTERAILVSILQWCLSTSVSCVTSNYALLV